MASRRQGRRRSCGHLALNGGWLALCLIVTCPFTLGADLDPGQDRAPIIFGLCSACAGASRGEVISGLAILAAFQLAVFLFRLALAQPIPAFMTETYGSAKADGTLTLYVVGMCIAAPIMEEFLFRGFGLRGWSQSFLGPVGAVALSSLVCGGQHAQYNLFYMFWIFTVGILLGTLRLRNGSTWLTRCCT